MNKSLLARTRPEFYADYVEAARSGGAYEEDIQKFVADSIRDAQALYEGKCPKCGAPSARYVDRKNQQGFSNMPGVWVSYRCSTAPPPGVPRGNACDFMVELKEGEEAELMEQIFELATLHGVRVMGVATTHNHRVRTVYLEAPSPRRYGDPEEKGQLGARQTMALGKMLAELGEAMLAGELRHDANKG